MSILPKLKLLRGGSAPRRVRKHEAPPGLVQFLEQSRVIAALIFIATVAAIVLISFVGVRTSDVPVLPNQTARVRIVANAPFNYESAELTRVQREQIRDRIPPVYRLEFEPLLQFETHIKDLLVAFERFEQSFPADAASTPAAHEQLESITKDFNAAGPYRTTVDDLRALLFLGNATQRFSMVEYALLVLKEIYAQGVHDDAALESGTDEGGKSQLELRRDEALFKFENEDETYQLLKDIAENLEIGYDVGETLITKLKQTHDVKERVYRRAVTFFTTNEHVFTILGTVYMSQHGLHEVTQATEAMKDGVNKGLEDVADLGRELERAALRAGYGSTIDPASVQKLVDAISGFQIESLQTIAELRRESDESAKAIRKAVEEGKKKYQETLAKHARGESLS